MMIEKESSVWRAFADVVRNFLGKELVTKLMSTFRDIGVNMSMKMKYLFCHLDDDDDDGVSGTPPTPKQY